MFIFNFLLNINFKYNLYLKSDIEMKKLLFLINLKVKIYYLNTKYKKIGKTFMSEM
jgi:hypothetical protein